MAFVSPKTVAHGFVKRFCATDRFEKLLWEPVSQTVSYFTVPPRAHPSTGSQSGSATPGLTTNTSTEYSLQRGLLNCRK